MQRGIAQILKGSLNILFRGADKNKTSMFSEISDLIISLIRAISDRAVTLDELEQIAKELADVIRKISEIGRK